MITLPDSEFLIRQIRDGLTAVSDLHSEIELTTGDWFPEIAKQIASRVSGPHIDCYARGKHRGEKAEGCKGNEWLFDFCAVISDPEVTEADRFMAQAAIVGEVEWAIGGTDQDFEKLMVVDSLVCFFVWQALSENAQIQLARLVEAARRRREYCRQHGMTRLPAFLLSCWVYPQNMFLDEVLT